MFVITHYYRDITRPTLQSHLAKFSIFMMIFFVYLLLLCPVIIKASPRDVLLMAVLRSARKLGANLPLLANYLRAVDGFFQRLMREQHSVTSLDLQRHFLQRHNDRELTLDRDGLCSGVVDTGQCHRLAQLVGVPFAMTWVSLLSMEQSLAQSLPRFSRAPTKFPNQRCSPEHHLSATLLQFALVLRDIRECGSTLIDYVTLHASRTILAGVVGFLHLTAFFGSWSNGPGWKLAQLAIFTVCEDVERSLNLDLIEDIVKGPRQTLLDLAGLMAPHSVLDCLLLERSSPSYWLAIRKLAIDFALLPQVMQMDEANYQQVIDQILTVSPPPALSDALNRLDFVAMILVVMEMRVRWRWSPQMDLLIDVNIEKSLHAFACLQGILANHVRLDSMAKRWAAHIRAQVRRPDLLVLERLRVPIPGTLILDEDKEDVIKDVIIRQSPYPRSSSLLFSLLDDSSLLTLFVADCPAEEWREAMTEHIVVFLAKHGSCGHKVTVNDLLMELGSRLGLN
jgi:hypothetical protein